MTQLTQHFSLDELTFTQHRSLDNTPPPKIIACLQVAAGGMEHVRALLGFPIRVNSGYRSPAVNAAVGGVATSAHCTGFAVDFVCPGFGTPLDVCRQLVADGLKFDQLIQEGTWVHVSFDPKMRGEVLTKTASGYRSGL